MNALYIEKSGRRVFAAIVLSMGLVCSAFAATNPYRGLWVGQVALNRVNEVTIPLDEDNNPIAPDPVVATPTADTAYFRLILHVNGSGQVSLLKDVAGRFCADGKAFCYSRGRNAFRLLLCE